MSLNRPKMVTGFMAIMTLFFLLGAFLPSVWPQKFPFLLAVKVDTDPENMLSEDEPVRVFHKRMKEEFSLYDMIVVGVVNDVHPYGVFNKESLKKIHELSLFARELNWLDKKDSGKRVGVISSEIISPDNIDNIEPGGNFDVKFEWLMKEPPETDDEAKGILEKAKKIPFLNDTLVSKNGKAMCIYLPITSKDLSYKVYSALNKKIASFKGDEKFYITGLPVANDTFGVEMFKQMAICAPVAMFMIFLLMLYFFRKWVLIVSPLILAFCSCIITMGFLIMCGNTVHIMSSMIPIFIMPIAVLDSVHILSEFFDRYKEINDRKKTIEIVMSELFTPMLYTSLTSMAGFVSLTLAPIPPVQVFGLYVGFGIMLAWFFTVTFIPAYIMFIPEKSLKNFGKMITGKDSENTHSFLYRLGKLIYSNARMIIILTFVLVLISIYGVTKIQINDNPVKWFTKSHPIRVADRELNKHFGGSYMAYLNLGIKGEDADKKARISDFKEKLLNKLKKYGMAGQKINDSLNNKLDETFAKKGSEDFLTYLHEYALDIEETQKHELKDVWTEVVSFIDEEIRKSEVFKNPQVLKYISRLQEDLLQTGIVGKSFSVSDIVKTVHQKLYGGEEKYFIIPESGNSVAECLFIFQNSHRPDDLWHFVTQDYRKASLWIQLKYGNNKDMSSVVERVKLFMKNNPPPSQLEGKWSGLTYINIVWQKKMVWGMLRAFLGSFLVVFIMMTLLFRSAIWGILSMIPLTVTITVIYGAVGFGGRDYDMPIAVLSALTLGLAIDFAIHFLARCRGIAEKNKGWNQVSEKIFNEPARAISRNIIVIAMGFTPLLAAPLIPYRTVGVFMAIIMAVSGISTLVILPALIRVFENRLFLSLKRTSSGLSHVTCLILALTSGLIIYFNLDKYIVFKGTYKLLLAAFICAAYVLITVVSKKVYKSQDNAK